MNATIVYKSRGAIHNYCNQAFNTKGRLTPYLLICTLDCLENLVKTLADCLPENPNCMRETRSAFIKSRPKKHRTLGPLAAYNFYSILVRQILGKDKYTAQL
jgi:hypothetical protein